MKHNIIKRGLIFTLILALIFSSTCFAFAATVGDQLTSPESGWQRFNSNNYAYFHYYGDYEDTNDSGCYDGEFMKWFAGGLNFKFNGTKFRIITCLYSGDEWNVYSDKINVTIDSGTADQINETYSAVRATNGVVWYQRIAYEKTGLKNGTHTVTISYPGKRANPNVTTLIDAIDIDDTGTLLSYNAPADLQATSGDSKVSLTWDKVDGAISYNVKRSTTKGGPYTTNIATNLTDTKCPDLSVNNGTTYYYVVTAVTSSGEGPNSNEASATPQKAASSGNAILDIKMNDGSTKEYRLTSDELTDFLTWYESRSRGEAKAFYTFKVKGDVSPFSSIDNYLPFDKILSFDVKSYS